MKQHSGRNEDATRKNKNVRFNNPCFLLIVLMMIWYSRCGGDQFDNQCGGIFPLHLQSAPTLASRFTDHFPHFDQWHHMSQHSQHFEQNVKRKRGTPTCSYSFYGFYLGPVKKGNSLCSCLRMQFFDEITAHL